MTLTAPDLLTEAAALIDQRGVQRDLPAERSMRRAVSAFNALSGQTLTETQGWLFVAVLKLSRALAGSFQKDDLLDAAAYVALALECELAAQPVAAPAAISGVAGAGVPYTLPTDRGGLKSAHRPPDGPYFAGQRNPALP